MKVEVRATGLRAKRDAMGWTQRELAKRLGVTQNYIPRSSSALATPVRTCASR